MFRYEMTYSCWAGLKPAERVTVLMDEYGMKKAEAQKYADVADAHDLPRHEDFFRDE